MVPERTQKKLDGVVGHPTLVPDVDLEQAGKELAADMEAEWVQDWSEIRSRTWIRRCCSGFAKTGWLESATQHLTFTSDREF